MLRFVINFVAVPAQMRGVFCFGLCFLFFFLWGGSTSSLSNRKDPTGFGDIQHKSYQATYRVCLVLYRHFLSFQVAVPFRPSSSRYDCSSTPRGGFPFSSCCHNSLHYRRTKSHGRENPSCHEVPV